MLVSNRLVRAALSAFAERMAADADAAIQRYESAAPHADYASQACNLRAILETYGDGDISITCPKVLLPGEKI